MRKMMKIVGVAKVMLLTMTTALMLAIGMVGEIVGELNSHLKNIKWSKQPFKSLESYLGFGKTNRVAMC